MLERFLFKKVEIWFVFLLLLTILIGAILFSYLVWYNVKGGEKFRFFTGLAVEVAKLPHTGIKTAEMLIFGSEMRVDEGFPGLSGFNYAYEPRARGEQGYLLLNRFDGDRKRSVSELVDLDAQKTVHTWIYDTDPIWAKTEVSSNLHQPRIDAHSGRFQAFHVLLGFDGSVVTQGFGTPLLKFDLCSKLIWVQPHDMFHHSIEADSDGNIWVPSYLEPKRALTGRDTDFHDDAITKVSPGGEILFQKSVIEILDENGLGMLVYGTGQVRNNDPIHLNDIQPAPFSGPYWRKGDLFLSLRNQSMVLLYRPSENKVLWHKVGPWTSQHDVDILDENRIAVFNNNTRVRGVSELYIHGANDEIVYDFRDNSVHSPMKVAFEKLKFDAVIQGLADFRPNNELMVENSTAGRLAQFDSVGNVTWQYINRARDGHIYITNWSRPVPRELGDIVARAAKEASCHGQ